MRPPVLELPPSVGAPPPREVAPLLPSRAREAAARTVFVVVLEPIHDRAPFTKALAPENLRHATTMSESPRPLHSLAATSSSEASAKNDSADTFAVYLAKRLVGDKRFRPGVPEEAAALAQASDIALSHVDLGLTIACILDRESDSSKHFAFSQEELVEIGRSCLKYTGTVNGAKMPVSLALYEVGSGPASEDDLQRLSRLQRTAPGLKKVGIGCHYLDTRTKTVWSGAPVSRLLQRVGYRGFLHAVLNEPRRADGEIFVADAALPQQERRPIATASLLAFLVVMFVVEHLAKVGDEGAGLLGVDTRTLFALGAMNSTAVLKDGDWYRLLCAALLHADLIHLLLNGLALGLAGRFLESLLGRAWFLSLFFVGALGGSLLALLVNPASVVSVGASGAVMGLLAAALVAAMRFPPGSTRTQIQLPLLQFLIPSLIPLAIHPQGGHIDFAAHFGGAIAGGFAGYALMKIWPRNEQRPRYGAATNALAAIGIACFAFSLFSAKREYTANAAEVGFSSQNVLVEDGKIPADLARAKKEVEIWGKDRPRDPRVHLFRALRLIDEQDFESAEKELRLALSEREILDRAFSNRKLETGIRSVLSELLLQQGRRADAIREASPICSAAEDSAQSRLRELGLCD